MDIMQEGADLRASLVKLQRRMKALLGQGIDGTLVSKRKPNGQFQFYLKKHGDPKLHYINREEEDLIRRLLITRYAKERLDIVETDLELLNSFLKRFRPYGHEDILTALPKVYRDANEFCETRGLIKSKKPNDPQVYPSEKTSDPAELRHVTSFGLHVRSKGEALIAEALYRAGIDIRYEKKLLLTDAFGYPVEAYPDFTILRKKAGILYLEHKGMLGSAAYAQKDQRKNDLYFRNGIYQPKNLIVTCDGPDGSTDMRSIELLIRSFILPQC